MFGGGGGGGIVSSVKALVPSLASVWVGDALTATLKARIPVLRGIDAFKVGLGASLLGGFLLRKFGGPLRKHATTFTAANLLWNAYNAIPFSMGGYATAQRVGLAPTIGASGARLSDFAIAGSDPAYGQIGSPALYGGVGDYVTALGYGG